MRGLPSCVRSDAHEASDLQSFSISYDSHDQSHDVALDGCSVSPDLKTLSSLTKLLLPNRRRWAPRKVNGLDEQNTHHRLSAAGWTAVCPCQVRQAAVVIHFRHQQGMQLQLLIYHCVAQCVKSGVCKAGDLP
jgi:hypothetical protein